MPYSEKLKQVLGEPDGVLAGISGARASIHVAQAGGQVSASTINKLKAGVYGEPKSLWDVGKAYGEEIARRFKGEMESTVSSSAPDAAGDFLWALANRAVIGPFTGQVVHVSPEADAPTREKLGGRLWIGGALRASLRVRQLVREGASGQAVDVYNQVRQEAYDRRELYQRTKRAALLRYLEEHPDLDPRTEGQQLIRELVQRITSDLGGVRDLGAKYEVGDWFKHNGEFCLAVYYGGEKRALEFSCDDLDLYPLLSYSQELREANTLPCFVTAALAHLVGTDVPILRTYTYEDEVLPQADWAGLSDDAN